MGIGVTQAQSAITLTRHSGLIFGRVIDADSGRPVPDAEVSAYGLGDSRLADAEGQFAFFDVPPGEYRIVVRKPGYAVGEFGQTWVTPNRPVVFPGTPDAFAHRLVLTKSQPYADLTIRLWRHGAVTGRVLDEAGEPQVGVLVQAWPLIYAAGQRWLNNVTAPASHTDDRGVFRMAELVPGEYALVVPAVSITTPDNQPAATRNLAEWSMDLMGLLHRFAPTRMYEEAVPVAGSPLTVARDRFLTSFIGQAPPPSSGGLAYTTTFYPGVSTTEQAATIRVRPGHEEAGLDISLTPVATRSLSGTVTGPDGPRRGVAVVLRDAFDATTSIDVALALTDEHGAFQMLGVPPGTFRMTVLDAPHVGGPARFVPRDVPDSVALMTYGARPWSDAETLWANETVTIGNTDIRDLAIRLQPAGRVEGRLVFKAGERPADGALQRTLIELDRADGRLIAVRAASEIEVRDDGSFRSVGLEPGRYYLRVLRPPAGWALESATVGGRDISVEPFWLEPAGLRGVEVVFTKTPNEISGVVRRSDGGFNPDAAVVVLTTDQNRWRNYGAFPRQIVAARADSQGRYRITGLPAGEYHLSAVTAASLVDWHDPAFFAAVAAQARRVVLRADDRLTIDLLTSIGQ